MWSQIYPYFLIFGITGMLMGLLYWGDLRQKAKKRAARINNLKLNKAQVIAAGLTGLTAAESMAYLASHGLNVDEDSEFFFSELDSMMDRQMAGDIVQQLMMEYNERLLDSTFEDMNNNSVFDSMEAFDNNEDLFSRDYYHNGLSMDNDGFSSNDFMND